MGGRERGMGEGQGREGKKGMERKRKERQGKREGLKGSVPVVLVTNPSLFRSNCVNVI